MTYIEWRDELKSYLGTMPRSEREEIFSYFAEMYADKRDAGLSEREIIAEFGAPYDVAQRILRENGEKEFTDEPVGFSADSDSRRAYRQEKSVIYRQEVKPEKKSGHPFLFIILLLIFCIPLLVMIGSMIIVTIIFCVAPIGIMGGGVVGICASVGGLMTGEINYFICMLGINIAVFGAGLLLTPIFFKLVKLMWRLFKKLFLAIKSLFSGKERA